MPLLKDLCKSLVTKGQILHLSQPYTKMSKTYHEMASMSSANPVVKEICEEYDALEKEYSDAREFLSQSEQMYFKFQPNDDLSSTTPVFFPLYSKIKYFLDRYQPLINRKAYFAIHGAFAVFDDFFQHMADIGYCDRSDPKNYTKEQITEVFQAYINMILTFVRDKKSKMTCKMAYQFIQYASQKSSGNFDWDQDIATQVIAPALEELESQWEKENSNKTSQESSQTKNKQEAESPIKDQLSALLSSWSKELSQKNTIFVQNQDELGKKKKTWEELNKGMNEVLLFWGPLTRTQIGNCLAGTRVYSINIINFMNFKDMEKLVHKYTPYLKKGYCAVAVFIYQLHIRFIDQMTKRTWCNNDEYRKALVSLPFVCKSLKDYLLEWTEKGLLAPEISKKMFELLLQLESTVDIATASMRNIFTIGLQQIEELYSSDKKAREQPEPNPTDNASPAPLLHSFNSMPQPGNVTLQTQSINTDLSSEAEATAELGGVTPPCLIA